MEVVFGFQEVDEIVKNGYHELGANPDVQIDLDNVIQITLTMEIII